MAEKQNPGDVPFARRALSGVDLSVRLSGLLFFTFALGVLSVSDGTSLTPRPPLFARFLILWVFLLVASILQLRAIISRDSNQAFVTTWQRYYGVVDALQFALLLVPQAMYSLDRAASAGSDRVSFRLIGWFMVALSGFQFALAGVRAFRASRRSTGVSLTLPTA